MALFGYTGSLKTRIDTLLAAKADATALAAKADLVGGKVPQAQLTTFSGTLLDVSYSTTRTYVPNGFRTMICNTVAVDAASAYNSTTGIYTVPTTGVYLIIAKVRPGDAAGSTALNNLGIGVDTQSADFPGFIWSTSSAPSTVATRWTITYQRVAMFTTGDQLRLFCYLDGGTNRDINTASMQIIRIA